MSSKYLCINTPLMVVPENIKFGKPRKEGQNGNCLFCPITYKGTDFLMRGPWMKLGSNVVKTGNQMLVDLVFDLTKKANRNFLKVLSDLDSLLIGEIYEHPKIWTHETSETRLTLPQIEYEYVSSIRSSSIYNHRQSLITKNPIDEIEFYDQDDVVVPYQLLKEGYAAIPLLSLKALHKNESHYWAQWELVQLKIFMPPVQIPGCQLSDSSSENEEEEEVEETTGLSLFEEIEPQTEKDKEDENEDKDKEEVGDDQPQP